MRNYYKRGTYNAICDLCGVKFKADQLKKRWDGHYVCNKDYESRHPMDLYRHVRVERSLPWVRPDPNVSYIVIPLVIENNVVADTPTVPVTDETLTWSSNTLAWSGQTLSWSTP